MQEVEPADLEEGVEYFIELVREPNVPFTPINLFNPNRSLGIFAGIVIDPAQIQFASFTHVQHPKTGVYYNSSNKLFQITNPTTGLRVARFYSRRTPHYPITQSQGNCIKEAFAKVAPPHSAECHDAGGECMRHIGSYIYGGTGLGYMNPRKLRITRHGRIVKTVSS